MITKMRKLSVAGFSLVELMVVVAIIGILAAVAIPNFNKFQRRARAAETKSNLGALYDTEKSFLGEWEDYSDSLAAVGFSIDGTTRTELGIGAGATAAARYLAEAPAASMATVGTGFGLVSQVCGNATYGMGCAPAGAAQLPIQWGMAPTGAVALALGMAGVPGTFTASAATNVGSNLDEIWSMTDTKAFLQQQDGINSN
jgi:prepilin-type N-terminal cleavage/methylation domain-containing protein